MAPGLFTTIKSGLSRYVRLATLSFVVGLSACIKEKPTPTPLTEFSAPFVFGQFQLPEDNVLTEEGVALGRALFYDPMLSGNNKISCATCHLQSLAFTDGRAKAVGASGKELAFNSMSLANLMWGPQRFFWDGRESTLERQALVPILHVDEMDQNIDELIAELKADVDYPELFAAAYGEISIDSIGKALAAFQRTLVSSNSRYDQYLRGELKLTEKEEQGRKLFMAHPDTKVALRGGNCIDCHSQFVTAGFKENFDGFSNNGLDDDLHLSPGLEAVTGDPAHKGLFKVPTLRNIALTAPYMHDGRFDTLEEVLDHYNQGIVVSRTLSPLILEAENTAVDSTNVKAAALVSLHLTEFEKEAIIAFLHTLTDHQFITNEKFSNPFISN